MLEGNLIGTGGQVRLWHTRLFMSFDKSHKFKFGRKGNRGRLEDWYCTVWGEEVPTQAYPKESLGFTPTTGCEELEFFLKGFHPKAKGLLTWGVLYFIRLIRVEAGVADIGDVIPPLKSEKGELSKGATNT